MAGHPQKEDSLKALFVLEEAGADIIELGVPFSDPVADGPVNQRASQIALANGMTLKGAINQVKNARDLGLKVPVVLFSYFNPIFSYGEEAFIHDAKKAGVNGILVVDLPLEEGKDFYEKAINAKLEIILLASPTTNPQRLILYKYIKPSFIYYISRLAVTGIQSNISDNLRQEVLLVKNLLPEYNIAVGFGISSPEQARAVAGFANGVVVGSKLVFTLESEGFLKFNDLAVGLAKAVHGE